MPRNKLAVRQKRMRHNWWDSVSTTIVPKGHYRHAKSDPGGAVLLMYSAKVLTK